MGDLVYDAAIHFESITTALMTTQTVVNQVLDLTPLDELLILEGYVEDLQLLASLAQDVKRTYRGFTSAQAQFQALFGMSDLPWTHAGYAARRSEVAAAVIETRDYAVCTRNLVFNSLRTINHMLALVSKVRAILGNVQGIGVLQQSQAKLAQILLEGNLTQAAEDQAETMQRADEISAVESLRLINADVFKSWPEGRAGGRTE